MNSRKKLIVSLSIVALVVVAAVVAVVGVFAAGNQQIQSQLFITFTAVDIEGDVAVRYNTQTVDAIVLSDWEGYSIKEAGSASFTASEGPTTKNIALGTKDAPIVIPGSGYVALVEYTFTCKDVQYGAKVSFAENNLFKAQVLIGKSWEDVTAEGSSVFANLGEDKSETVIMKIYPKDFSKNIKVSDYYDEENQLSSLGISWQLVADL